MLKLLFLILENVRTSYCYQPAGHILTEDLKIITDSRIWSIICRVSGYRFPSKIDFTKCREESVWSLQFCDRWCRWEHVESGAVNVWRLNVFFLFFHFVAAIWIFFHLNLGLVLYI